MSAVKEAYSEHMQVALMLGGLRPGTTEPITSQARDQILHHWHEVQRRTGQSFAFEDAMPDGFVYDTEPPSRAVIAVAEINANLTFAFFRAIQAAFYAKQQNVTDTDTLIELAKQHQIETSTFLERFQSEDAKKRTQTHFYRARQAGVSGFPTVILQNGSNYSILTRGYRPFEELKPELDIWLDEPEAAPNK